MVERVGLYMANLRPKIVKLAKMVGGVAGAMNRIDEKAPEYYALNAVVTDDMADVALVMGLRQPRTFEYIVEKCGTPATVSISSGSSRKSDCVY